MRVSASAGFGERAELDGVHDGDAGFNAAAHFEGDDAGVAVFGVLALGKVMLGMRAKARVEHAQDGGMRGEPLGDFEGGIRVATDAEREGLEALEREPRFEGRLDRAYGLADEAEAFEERCVACGDRAADGGVVPFDVLGGRVEADGRAGGAGAGARA